MINGFIKGQALTLSSPVIASGTINYLTARFTFFTNEWEHLDEIWVHFRQGDKVFDAQVVDGRVKEDEHINLTEGEWNVYLHGNVFENGEVKQRITTEPQTVQVVATGNLKGEPFPNVDETAAEKLLAVAKNAEEKADKAIKAVADVHIQKGVQSLTAFPEVAKEGDVVLLHRCNEIGVDDSNSGVVLDTAAIASLKLPERITNRYWEFEAPNPTGKGFILVLEQDVIEEAEPYELTGIFLLSENYGGRWYWRDGEPYNDISNASTEPIPALIPLGKVLGFTATKDPLVDEDYDEHEDTDNTTIFRTVPREYMYSGGEWKLTERTDIAEGNLISDFGEIEKDGQKFFRLDLTDSRSLKNRNKKAVDIPIEGVKKTTTTVGGITLESEEIVFPKAEAGGIKSVSALPDVANEGDVVYYCPPANTLTSADSNHRVYINFSEVERLQAWVLDNPDKLTGDMNIDCRALLLNANGETVSWGCTPSEILYGYSPNLEANLISHWILTNDEWKFADDLEGGYSTSDLPYPYFNIGAVDDEYLLANSVFPPEYLSGFEIFYVNPRFYRYANGEWVEILTPEVDVDLTDYYTKQEIDDKGFITAKDIPEVSNITPEQTTFFEFFPANNLLDVSTKQIGLLNNNGNIHTGGSYDTYRYFEQYIPVDEGDEISVQYTRYGVRYTTANGDYNIARVAAYDSDKQILKTLGAVTSGSNKVSVYKVPATVKFIRLSLSQTIDQCTDIAVVKNTNDVVPYEEYNTSTAYLKEQYLKTKKKDIVAFLPDEIVCAVGRTIEIYNKQVCPLAEKYHFRWVCNVGKALERKFSITGTEALIGNYALTLEIYDDEEACLYSKASTLKIVSNALTDNIMICPIGDSLTNSKQWLNEVPTLSDNKISYVGTRGGGKHEGRSGFTSTGYTTAHGYDFEQNNVEDVHPFWDGSKFSWSYYKENSGINPTAVQIFLGTNDLFGQTTAETFSANIKTMVDSIRSADTNIPIFVVLTILTGNQNGLGKQQSTDGFAAYKGKYKYSLDCKFINAMNLLYDTLKGYDNLYFVPLTECHDNEYNFGAVETPVNPRATQTEYMPNEGIHPQKQGYEQMADVMYSVYCHAFTSQ